MLHYFFTIILPVPRFPVDFAVQNTVRATERDETSHHYLAETESTTHWGYVKDETVNMPSLMSPLRIPLNHIRM